MEDYHTHYLGKTATGQLFWAYETFAFTKPRSDIEPKDDWEKYRKEYALIHTFDNDGNYISTKHCSCILAELGDVSLADKLEEMVADLGDFEFQDIEIKIFQTKIDDIIFGLVVDEETEMINLQPSSTISFLEPWDGEYYT